MAPRWTDEMLDKMAEENAHAFRELREAISRLETQVSANTQAIAANNQAIHELREGQAMMMQIIMQQQTNIEELRQDTRRILDALINPPPMNGHR
ncbi:hypothetical protein [Synechococcus sp. C9]|jgi:uncharacterized coiled-coil DUF342 family protein|uniref:hypothetical protein n=1 Tax=Synechococcus sp. C9 TaxID=102119 RepID=UPI001FF23D80|nr:hypothetical protein [Synechococcus sp. C9]